MNHPEGPSVGQFRAAAQAFLDANAKRRDRTDRPFVWGQGDDDVSVIEETEPGQDEAVLHEAQTWAALRWDSGFGWIDGPPEYGGAGLPAGHKVAYQAVEADYDVPDQSCFTISHGLVGPTIVVHANEEVKQRYLPALYRGDILACQLFSEPGAGSDLASLTTRAVRDGDGWMLNGQKVWASNAHLADIGEIICRSDPDQPKHRGLTAFIIDMKAPGVEVVPLRQMTGGAGFNEVFLHDVPVSDSHRLGDVNAGWGVALTTLMNERAAVAAGRGLGRGPGPFERLIALLRHVDLIADPTHRQRLAALYAQHRVGDWTLRRVVRDAQTPGPELSLLKLLSTRQAQDISDYVTGVLGPSLVADTGEWGTYAWTKFVCGAPGYRLGGGSDEILRNIVSERVLGLPKDPGVDTTTPFKDQRHA